MLRCKNQNYRRLLMSMLLVATALGAEGCRDDSPERPDRLIKADSNGSVADSSDGELGAPTQDLIRLREVSVECSNPKQEPSDLGVKAAIDCGSYDGAGNFMELSASDMIDFTLARGERLASVNVSQEYKKNQNRWNYEIQIEANSIADLSTILDKMTLYVGSKTQYSARITALTFSSSDLEVITEPIEPVQ